MLATKENISHQQPPHTENDSGRTSAHTHQPLQRAELDSLKPLPQCRSLLFNSSLRLFDLKFLAICFLANSALLEVQV